MITMEKLMLSNKYDLGCVLVGVISSTFATDLIEKTVVTCISMLVATTVAFYWRKHLHKRHRESLRKKAEEKKEDK